MKKQKLKKLLARTTSSFGKNFSGLARVPIPQDAKVMIEKYITPNVQHD